MKKHDVFISYKSDDEYFAKSILNSIEKLGFVCWISSRDISDGGAFNREISRAIENSGTLVLILSKKSDESEEVERELALATQNSVNIIPINIDNCRPKNLLYWLSRIQWISLSECGNFDDIALRIIKKMGKSIVAKAGETNTFQINIYRFIPIFLGMKTIENVLKIKISNTDDLLLNNANLHLFNDGFAVVEVNQCLTYSNVVEMLLDRRNHHQKLLLLKDELPEFFDKKDFMVVNNPIFANSLPKLEYVMSIHHIFDNSKLNECEIFSICEPSFIGITDDPTQTPSNFEDANLSLKSLTPSKALSVIQTVASKHNTFYVSWSNVVLVDNNNPSTDFEILKNLQIDLQKLWYQLYVYDNALDNCILSPEDYNIQEIKKEIIKLKIAYSKFIKINPTGAGHINRLKEVLISTSNIASLYNNIDDKLKYL